MKDSTVLHYVRMADKLDYGYQTYGGDASIAALRCFRQYHKDGRWAAMVGGRGLTDAQMRILAVLQRHGARGEGLLKIRDVAAETRTSPGYVSRVVLKLNAWGFVATISIRGRSGGLFVALRQIGDTLAHYADEARARIYASKIGAAARALRRGINVSSMGTLREMRFLPATSSLLTMEETFPKLRRFERDVYLERARLAIEDPAGEADAIAPLALDKAYALERRLLDQKTFDASKLADDLGIDHTRDNGRVACPAHGDGRKLTLSWRWSGDRLLLHCFAGCTFDEIRRAAS